MATLDVGARLAGHRRRRAVRDRPRADRSRVSGAERGRAIAAWGSTVGFAVAAGPLLGGLITDSLGWRWIFFVNVPVGAVALYSRSDTCASRATRDASRTDVAGLVCFSASLFLIVFGLLRGNAAGWASGADRRLARRGRRAARRVRRRRDPPGAADARRVALPAAGVRRRAARDVLHRRRACSRSSRTSRSTCRTSTATHRSAPGSASCRSPSFIFFVPLLTRKVAARVPLWLLLCGSLALVALGLAAAGGRVGRIATGRSCCPASSSAGIGIGLANPTIAGAALRVVDPARTGMASGISNTCRIGGLAIGVAVFGVLLQHRVGDHLAAAGYPGKSIAAAVSSSGLRAAAGRPALAPDRERRVRQRLQADDPRSAA